MRLVPVSNEFKWDEEQASYSSDDVMYVDGGLHMVHENGMCHTI